MAVAASLAAEAAAWQKRDFGGGGSALGSTAAPQWRQQQCSSGSGRSAVAGSLVMAVAAWRQQSGSRAAAAVAVEARWQRGQLGCGGKLGSGGDSLAAARPRLCGTWSSQGPTIILA